MRRLSGAARAELTDALASSGWSSALAFAEAVTLHVAQPLGDRDGGPPAFSESRAARAILDVLASASPASAVRPGEAAATASTNPLISDPRLLAAVFQNVDLLYRDRFPYADGVSHLVMQALSAIEEAEPGSLPDTSPSDSEGPISVRLSNDPLPREGE